MLEETSGRAERRAVLVVNTVLIIEALWTFLHKHLPLDAALWTSQAELVHRHLSGASVDGWSLIPYPAANIGGPLIAGLMTFLFPAEVSVRLLLVVVGIFLKGAGLTAMFRSMRVRDEAIYYLIPVLVWSGIWFSGALPYLMAETVAVWVLAFFLTQERPSSIAYWVVSLGLGVVALFHASVFLFAGVVVIAISLEQRRSVHLSQGWMSSGKAVMSLLVPGTLILFLGFLGGEPLFSVSSSSFLPHAAFGRLLFIGTAAPDVLEATFRYGDLVHGLVSLGLSFLLLGLFARAFFLAMEEVTWRSRALKSSGFLLIVLALASPLLNSAGIDTSAWLGIAISLALAGAYSRGPAVRRTYIDRLLLGLSLIIMIVAGVMNGFSVELGSQAADDAIASARRLIGQDKQSVLEDEHLTVQSVRLVVDSSLAQQYADHSVATFSYGLTAPMYLATGESYAALAQVFQPMGGIARTADKHGTALDPGMTPTKLTLEQAARPGNRIIAMLPTGTKISPNFAPFPAWLKETGGIVIDRGEVKYRMSIGSLVVGHPSEMALLFQNREQK